MLLLCSETLTALGPSFIKAGQVLASRPDIIREDYMNELCVLQVRSVQIALVSRITYYAHVRGSIWCSPAANLPWGL